MRGLPSKFATGNFSLAILLFFIIGAPFYWMGTLYLLTYLWSPLAYVGVKRYYSSRAKKHKILNPPSVSNSLYSIETKLDTIMSDIQDIHFQITYYKHEGG